MFGIFGNKKEKEQEKVENPEFLKLVEKWDVFLEKMETRFNESLVNAKEALLENLEESDYDINPTMTAWQGIKSQLMALGNKVDTTFDEKVLPQMKAYKEHYDLLDEAAKATHLREKIIFKKMALFEIEIEGEVSQRFYNHAIQFLNKDFNCTQCSAKLEVRKDIFRPHYVSCDYCNTVNTFIPNDKISQIRWVVDNIAKYNCIKEWQAMENAKEEYKALRSWTEDEDMSQHKIKIKNWEVAQRAYWTKYFTLRSEFLPEYAETIAHDTDVKMKWFYEQRKRDLNY